jgi:hypothetical protein
MRTLSILLIGAAMGATVMFAGLDLVGKRYAYFTVPRYECEGAPPMSAEVVPHQPNPCHFRRPRW